MKTATLQRIKAGLAIPLFHGLMITTFFLLAGRIDLPFVWAFLAIQIVNSLVIVGFISPQLLAERLKRRSDIKQWDLFFNRAFVVLGIVLFLSAGLDLRFGLSPVISDWVKIAAALVSLAAGIFADWALFTNSFFSRYVRIQKDRGHRLIDTGPYAIIRHPAYFSSIIAMALLPLILGSLWAYLSAGAYIALLLLRTLREESALKDELEGYLEYTKRVRYRIIPGIF